MRADPICPDCGAPLEVMYGDAPEDDPKVVWVCNAEHKAWGQNWDRGGDRNWYRVQRAERQIFFGQVTHVRPGFVERVRRRLGL